MTLQTFFQENPRVALAFSGGVDSAYLLYEAVRFSKRVCAYYVKSAFQPRFELEDAQRLAAELGAEMKILDVDLFTCPDVIANPARRCYYCKTALFQTILSAAAADGFPVVIDGTNASDSADDRPGMAALRELSVRSPLRECGLAKAEIRQRSHDANLFTWDKPAYACLATRIPVGEPITPEKLQATESAEAVLASLGFRDFRVRWLDGCARIQLPESQLPLLLEKRELVLNALHETHRGVLLDLEVRNG